MIFDSKTHYDYNDELNTTESSYFIGKRMVYRITYVSGKMKKEEYFSTNDIWGCFHRVDGPAVICYLLDGSIITEYFLNGKHKTLKQYKKEIKLLNIS